MKVCRGLSVAVVSGLIISMLCGCGSTGSRRTIGSIADTDGDGAQADAEVEITLVIASNQTSQENPYHYGLETFKEVAEELSGGTI